jgi:hypothetical protein
MSQAQIEEKVEDYLRNSQALEDYWQRQITPDQLQAERPIVTPTTTVTATPTSTPPPHPTPRRH